MGSVSDPCENAVRIQELQDQVTVLHVLKLSATANSSPIPLPLTWAQFLTECFHCLEGLATPEEFVYKDSLLF